MRSKERAKELGEVFTPEHLVSDILTQIPDSSSTTKYFEPGCGSGNFLIQILERKLELIRTFEPMSTQRKSPDSWMRACFFALSSIYGVDIDKDNINESRSRLRERLFEEAGQISKDISQNSDFWESIDFVLEKNIVVGDLINFPDQVEIADYAELPDNQVKTRYFWFSELIHPDDEVLPDSVKLFDHVPASHRSEPVKNYLQVKR
jgi:hypothetical protein